jgi:sterol 14-demethylase
MTTLSSLALLLLLVLVVYLLKPPSIPGIPTATPCLPLVGNAIHFGIDPVNFLVRQRARHGDVFLVNLAIIRVVFFLGPEGTNAILKGTEKGGISFWEALRYVIGGAVDKGPPLPLLLIAVPL